MCTLFFHQEFSILAKNRDKNEPANEEIVRTESILAVRTQGADYFGLGVNKFGCGFVSAAINSPEWTATAAGGDIERARDIFAAENEGLTSPTKIVSENLSDAKSVDCLVKILEETNCQWMGYNVLLADGSGAALVETYRDQTYVHHLGKQAVVTNHFLELPYGPIEYEGYPNSYDRYDAAEKAIQNLGRKDIYALLRPAEGDQNLFWRDGHFFTVSSNLINITQPYLQYRSRGAEAFATVTFA